MPTADPTADALSSTKDKTVSPSFIAVLPYIKAVSYTHLRAHET